MEIHVNLSNASEVLNDPLFRGMLDSISDGVVVIDAKSRDILALNGVARGLLAYKESEPLGCQCRRVMNSPVCATSCPLTAILDGRTPKNPIELYYRGRGGEKMLHAQTKMLLVCGTGGTPLVGVELFRDLREVRSLQKNLGLRRSLKGLVGSSESMQLLYQNIEQIAPYDISVMLRGESGVGKERVADAIHALSLRAERPFIKVNCAALSPMLVESELFGHCQGAFTGASKARRGLFEEADGGTLLLDEVGDLPLDSQAKLLRAVETGEIQRVGEDRIQRVNVRILCATNRRLEEEVEQGRFRSDLYYRLHIAVVEIPPLRDRPLDIPLLVSHFLGRFNEQLSPEQPWVLDEQAMGVLVSHSWPGNVRELENCLHLAVIRASRSSSMIKMEHLSSLFAGFPKRERADAPKIENQVYNLASIERTTIKRAMDKAEGNISAAARLLEIDRSTLWRKLKKIS